MEESGRVPGKGRIRASIEKLSRRIPKRGRMGVITEKWYNVSEHRDKVESVRVSKICPDRVPEKGRISVSTEKW